MARQNVVSDSEPNLRREQLLQAAALLFQKHGYQGATVRQIADATGLTSGSIFYYFKSKEDLLEEVIAQAMQSGLQIVDERLSTATGPLSRFQALVLAHLTAIMGPLGSAHDVSFRDWKSLSPDARDRLRTINQKYREVWMEVLNELKSNQYLLSDPERCRLYMLAALNWGPARRNLTRSSQLASAANLFCSIALNLDEEEFHKLCTAEKSGDKPKGAD